MHVVYLVALVALTKAMKGRAKPGWVKPFARVHNYLMSFLSAALLAALVWGAHVDGRFTSWSAFTCKRPHPRKGLVEFAMYAFYLSKMLEFVDSFCGVWS